LAEKGFNRIYHINIYSWHNVNRMWPMMEFPQVSHAATSVKGSKREIWF